MELESRALLIDIKRCIGCRACVSACKEAHGCPGGDEDTKLGHGLHGLVTRARTSTSAASA
jgi:Fe-S-cluster-containing dehydrogenase component